MDLNPCDEMDTSDYSIVLIPRMGGWSVKYTDNARCRRDKYFWLKSEASAFADELFRVQNSGYRRGHQIELR